MEAYNEPANEFWYLSHMCKVAHQTYMDIYQVGHDALFLVWIFLYPFIVYSGSEGSGNAAQKHRYVTYKHAWPATKWS